MPAPDPILVRKAVAAAGTAFVIAVVWWVIHLRMAPPIPIPVQ
jgi:hypothetical protein